VPRERPAGDQTRGAATAAMWVLIVNNRMDAAVLVESGDLTRPHVKVAAWAEQ